MSLEQTLLAQLDTQLLLEELKRRGQEPTVVPGLEQAPDLFVLNTLVDRLRKDATFTKDQVALLLHGLLKKHPDTLMLFGIQAIVPLLAADTLYDAIGDKEELLTCYTDDDLWNAISSSGQEEYMRQGNLDQIADKVREVRSLVNDILEALPCG